MPKSQFPCHYSGNFWWSHTNYTKNLIKLNEVNFHKNDPEFWLCGQDNSKIYNLHSSGINHYHNSYPREKYITDSF